MSLADPRATVDPNRSLRPLQPGEAEKGKLAAAAWAYAQKFPVGDQPAASLTYLKKNDPSFVLPSGYELDGNGNVQVDRGSWLARNWSYLALAAVGGAAAISALPAAAASGAVPGVTTSAELGPTTAANLAATSSIAGGSGVPSSLAAAGGSSAMSGLSYGDILKYGLPQVGNLVGGLIQANASGAATEAQQKYLEEALAYEKESDQYKRQIDANAVQKEANRYGDYTGRIAPFVANGTSSNDRMAALLGLPARSGSSGYDGATGGGQRYNTSSSADSGDPISYADRLSPADKLKVDALLKASNSNDNPAYWYGVNAQHGGFDATGADWNQRRISTGDGVGRGYAGGPIAPAAAPITTQPQARSASMVMLKAPDGSTRQVPADQAAFYQSKGATVLQGAA